MAEPALARTRLSRGGDFVPPGANVVARGLFIDAVTRLVPDALNELKALAAHLPDHNVGVVVPDRERFDLERPLREWCLKFGFTAVPWTKQRREDTGPTPVVPNGLDWLLDLARRTAQWLRNDDDPLQSPADVMKMCVTASYPAVNGPAPPRWDPDLETEEHFIGRQEAYRLAVKQQARAGGRIRARRVNRTHTVERDFEWLALFQVGRLEAAEIRGRCKSPRPSVDTIRGAIAEVANQAGVHLRTARRGRPRDE